MNINDLVIGEIYIFDNTLYKLDSERYLLSSPDIKNHIWSYDSIRYNELLNYNFKLKTRRNKDDI